MQDHIVRWFQNRVLVSYYYSLFKGEGCSLTQTGGQHRKLLTGNRRALCMHSSFPFFPPSFCLSSLILTSHLWAARTDRLHNQTREPPSRHLLTDQLEGRWFSCFVWAVTRWEAHRSPESSAHCLSASAGQKSFLLSNPYSRFYLCTLIVCLCPAWNTYFTTFICFPALKPISVANSVQQSGFLPNVQGSLGWFLQFITSINPTGKLLDASIRL